MAVPFHDLIDFKCLFDSRVQIDPKLIKMECNVIKVVNDMDKMRLRLNEKLKSRSSPRKQSLEKN